MGKSVKEMREALERREKEERENRERSVPPRRSSAAHRVTSQPAAAPAPIVNAAQNRRRENSGHVSPQPVVPPAATGSRTVQTGARPTSSVSALRAQLGAQIPMGQQQQPRRPSPPREELAAIPPAPPVQPAGGIAPVPPPAPGVIPPPPPPPPPVQGEGAGRKWAQVQVPAHNAVVAQAPVVAAPPRQREQITGTGRAPVSANDAQLQELLRRRRERESNNDPSQSGPAGPSRRA